MGNYYTDAYANCPSDQNPSAWSDAPYTKCERCYNRERDGNLCESCIWNWGKEGATKESCAGCSYFREPWTCKNPEHVCTLPPEKRKTFKLPRTHKLTMYDPALWNAFVKQFGGQNVRIVNVQDKIVDFSAEFHGVTVMYSDFCKNAEHEIERIVDGMVERAKQQAERTKEQMICAMQYKNGAEVRDG